MRCIFQRNAIFGFLKLHLAEDTMLQHTILWRRLDLPGHDACALFESDADDGYRLSGTAVFGFAERPCRLQYSVDCDRAWRTRWARVSGWIGKDRVDMVIVATQQGWHLNSVRQEGMEDCIDLDLNFTPATNLIALKRLALNIGDKAEAPAAWVSFPEMALERLEQYYHRTAPDTYDYRAPGVGYDAPLTVAENGFVAIYPELWEAEAMR